jgi:hypothetical protein
MAETTNSKGILRWSLRTSLLLDTLLFLGLAVKLWDVGPKGFWWWITGMQIAPQTKSVDGSFVFMPRPHYDFTVLVAGTVVGLSALTFMLWRLYMSRARRN